MKKYLVYGISRTGSIYFTHLLNEYFKNYLSLNNNVFYSQDLLAPDWSFPIQHTHQIKIVEKIPSDFVLLLTTRSILESVISQCVAQETKIYTLHSKIEEMLYKKQFEGLRFNINLYKFINKVKEFDYFYSNIFEIYKDLNVEKYIINYNDCIGDEINFFKTINVNANLNLKLSTVKKMSVDKFLMVKNLKRIIEVYTDIKVKNNFNDEISIANIEKNYIDKEKKSD
jgi:hypothetical protein